MTLGDYLVVMQVQARLNRLLAEDMRRRATQQMHRAPDALPPLPERPPYDPVSDTTLE